MGYDKERRFLEITFWNKSKYGFGDVTPAEAKRLRDAVSKGKEFWRAIREIKPTIKIKLGESNVTRQKRK